MNDIKTCTSGSISHSDLVKESNKDKKKDKTNKNICEYVFFEGNNIFRAEALYDLPKRIFKDFYDKDNLTFTLITREKIQWGAFTRRDFKVTLSNGTCYSLMAVFVLDKHIDLYKNDEQFQGAVNSALLSMNFYPIETNENNEIVKIFFPKYKENMAGEELCAIGEAFPGVFPSHMCKCGFANEFDNFEIINTIAKISFISDEEFRCLYGDVCRQYNVPNQLEVKAKKPKKKGNRCAIF